MTLSQFLELLDKRRIAYRLDRVRAAVMVVIATPGDRWEVEFMDAGGIEIERFQSDGTILDEDGIGSLLAALGESSDIPAR